MSATRHAEPDAPMSFERYRSHPEFKALNGLPGQHVAAKAALQTDPRAKSLLMFLQALTLRPGAVKKLAADILAMFPERIGTPSMHKFGVKPGTIYNAEQVRAVRAEAESDSTAPPTESETQHDNYLRAPMERDDEETGRPKRQPEYHGYFPLKGEFNPKELDFYECQNIRVHEQAELARLIADRDYESGEWKDDPRIERDAENKKRAREAQKHPATYPASAFLDLCQRRLASGLERFLCELCLNPAWRIQLPDTTERELARQSAAARENFPDLGSADFRDASLIHFRDIIGALLEFKARHEQTARENCADTAVARLVFRTLARGLRCRKAIVAVEGGEGIGKSYNGEAWCEQHLGEARFVRIRGNQNETSFYSAAWVAFGLGSPVNRKASELRSRVDRFLELSGMMLVIEEGHRLLPQSERIYSQPALMNWIYGLWDMGVPCALLVTPQFLSRLDAVERQTDWNSGQLKRRINPWVKLPARLSEADVRLVATKHAPNYTSAMIDEMVDFAAPTRHQLDAITRVSSAAEFIAGEDGRERVAARDLMAAIEEAQQTALALTTPLDRERQAKGGRNGKGSGRRTAAALPQDAGSDDATPLPGDGEDTLTDTETPARGLTPSPAFAATV